MNKVTCADVEKLTRPTDGFLCPLSANTYGIDFLQFTISDYVSKKIVFEVGRNTPPQDMSIDFSTGGEDMYRKIKYEFSEDVLRLPHIETSLVFSVGNQEIREFRMIERHYFRDQLVKSFNFQFGFCIPGSTNTWDAVYSLPALSEDLINDMINNPFDTKSDSFYFVNGNLVMHNKASYKYIREDNAQAKKSYESKFGSKGSKDVKVSATPGSPSRAPAKDGAPSPVVRINDSKSEVAEAKTPGKTESVERRKSFKGEKEIAWSKDEDYN